jgi:hypothetical protein
MEKKYRGTGRSLIFRGLFTVKNPGMYSDAIGTGDEVLFKWNGMFAGGTILAWIRAGSTRDLSTNRGKVKKRILVIVQKSHCNRSYK